MNRFDRIACRVAVVAGALVYLTFAGFTVALILEAPPNWSPVGILAVRLFTGALLTLIGVLFLLAGRFVWEEAGK